MNPSHPDYPIVKGWSSNPQFAGIMLGALLSSLFWISLFLLLYL